MMDSNGNFVVSQGPFHRATTVGQAATINSSTSAVTCLAAQGTGNFADIGTLLLTTTPGASSNTAFTVTLSDGTATYIFDLFTGSVATVTDPPAFVEMNFTPPIPATTANTAWTIASSSATVVVHSIITAFVQKASVL